MHKKLALAAIAATLAGCSTPPPVPPVPLPTLDDYKLGVAKRIVAASRDTYSTPVPEMLKSIIVLEIAIDKTGAPLEVSAFRTNGYDALTHRAIASVVDAAPFAPPAPALLQDSGSLRFLETFLFRDDDAFQLRSLVPAP
ncbi:MAG TPA: energy transducer TonB [Burkholderiales bacterium]|nr:energy transducer TonB [Burkholderiales bacterium]